MEIVEKGQSLEEWFRETIHTCHRCKTKFRAGKKAKAGRDYELCEMKTWRGSVKVACPHCKVALCLYAPHDETFLPPIPYYPQPIVITVPAVNPTPSVPSWPRVNPALPWQPSPYIVTCGQQVASGANVQLWNAADTVGALTADARVGELEARASGVFEIVN